MPTNALTVEALLQRIRDLMGANAITGQTIVRINAYGICTGDADSAGVHTDPDGEPKAAERRGAGLDEDPADLQPAQKGIVWPLQTDERGRDVVA